MRKGTIFQFKIVLVLFALCNEIGYWRCMYERNEKLVEKPFSTGNRQELKSGNMEVPRKFLPGFYTFTKKGNSHLNIFEIFPIYNIGFLYTKRSGFGPHFVPLIYFGK
jgi:hypothetical protein